MGRLFRFHLNIRQKVIVGLTIILLVVGSIGGMSYRYLGEVERKQHFVEVADDLGNTILEIRRYEKNYLLYDSDEDLIEYRRYVARGTEDLGKISPEAQDLKAIPMVLRLRDELATYARLMQEMTAGHGTRQKADETHLQEQLRERGKVLVDISQQLVAFERGRILEIISGLKLQLATTLGMVLVLGSFLIPMVAQRIIRPLRVIEKTTRRIGEGDFRPLPVLETHDETQPVLEAFNLMLQELEKNQDQLLQAKKLSSLGTLTSGIAHQLNNPLNNISTSCQIAMEELGEADPMFLHKMLTNIEQEVHRARDTVKGLLEFSRIKEFCLAPVLLSDVVERSISLISSQIPPGVRIVRNIPPHLSLNIDSQRMQQVFLNLLENAIHAMETSPGEIRISASMTPDESIRIDVEDSGKGIPEGLVGRVFDPFFTTKEVGVGTGLGLSVVYGIIQKHGGGISVESEPGQGARFVIRLPSETLCRPF